MGMRRRWCARPLLTVILTYVVCAHHAAGEVPFIASQLVEGYEKSLVPFSHVTYTCESRSIDTLNGVRRSSAEYGVHDDESGRSIFKTFYRRDGNRLDILSLKDGVPLGPDVWQHAETHLDHVVVDNSPAILEFENRTATLDQAVLSQRTPHGYTGMDSLRQQAWEHLGGGAALDGFIFGRDDKSLPEILRSATDLRVQPQPVVIDGNTTYELDCTDAIKQYRYQVCIDPKSGFEPRRIIQTRFDPQADGTDVFTDNIEIAIINGRFIPVSIKSKITFRSGADYIIKSEELFQRSDFNFDPDFTTVGAFKMTAPPNVHIRNEDFRELNWMLKNGKLVPKEDEGLVPQMDEAMQKASPATAASNTPPGVLPVPPSNESNYLVWSAGICLGAAALVVAYFFRKRGKA